MATESFWTRFREWRRGRPFWGGLLLVLSGLEMFLSANMALDDIEIHIGPQGFLSYLIPVLMLTSGALAWLSPAQRLFYGVVGTLTALYSFIGLNLGGWFAGMVLGIVGGALVIAWSPAPAAPVPPPSPERETPPHDSGEPTGEIPVISDAAIQPVRGERDPDHRPLHRKALIILAPLLLATSVVIGGNVRASAAPECPEGLPSISATASRTPAKAQPGPSRSTTKAKPGPSRSTTKARPGPSRATTPRPSPGTGAASDQIPCLGARQEGLVAEADGIPRAGVKPGLLKTASLTMYNSAYEGVVDVPTANGPITSLFFSMDKAVNKPFSLAIAEPDGRTTLIESGQLTTDGNVEFYSPRFTGKLFGLIPVTFTPEQPPPLTLPVLWFTDVTIDLAYVRCDVLTAKPLSINEV